MFTQHLQNLLSKLGLEEKVIYTDNTDYHKDIGQRLRLLSPDAIYIFNSQPLILFFDLTKNSRDLEDLYKKVWSFDNTCIVFIVKEKDIEVFNALNFVKKQKTLEKIDLTQTEIEQQYNLLALESGNTWHKFQEKYIEKAKGGASKKRANERLFSNIKKVRTYLTSKETNDKLTENEANALILRLIFVRYLIDRKIKIDAQLIQGDIENVSERRKNFIQLIREPQKLHQLFQRLNERFNGVLFKENDKIITPLQAEYLAGVFEGELAGKDSLFEGFFFDIFDFSIIPVELISGIYESLINEETRKLDSAVYTPSFLVDYILKDTVDVFLKTHNPEECTIFEVAVGSGIFLVQSLRRIIEREIELNGKENKSAFSEKIRNFAQKNLYGIDINPEALKVTCFSIYIALLDYLEPADINIYQFPELIGKNLFEANFFGKLDANGKRIKADFEDIIHQVKPQFILGNPPWKKSKKDDIIHTKWLDENQKTVGGFEIAQSFLLRVKDFMNDETKSALILTSTMFYNVSKTTKKFKKEVLTTYCIDKFFDLSAVKQSLFENQESPTSIVFFRLSQNNDYLNHVVKHHSLKVNSFLKNFRMLVIEKFDQKEILQKYFIEHHWMFKVALYGNTLDFHFLKRLETHKKIVDFIDNKTFFASSGILRGNRKKQHPELQGLSLVENNKVSRFYTYESQKIMDMKDLYLEGGRELDKFDKHKILFKEQAVDWTNLYISFNPQNSVFVKGVFGIASSNSIKLKELYARLITDLYTYFIFSISSGWGIATHPQTNWEDGYQSFPFIESNETTKTQLISLVDRFLEPFKAHYSQENILKSPPPINQDTLDKINDIINRIYGVSEHEKDLIDYVLNVSRYQFQEGKQDYVTSFTKDGRKKGDILRRYAEVYLQAFEEIYDNEYLQVEIYDLEYFIAMNFVMQEERPSKPIIFSQNQEAKSVLKALANLSIAEIVGTQDPEKNLFIQKDIKGFEENSFYIIKPNEYKCWHRAMAWYDVAEFRQAIQHAQVEHLIEVEPLNINRDEIKRYKF